MLQKGSSVCNKLPPSFSKVSPFTVGYPWVDKQKCVWSQEFRRFEPRNCHFCSVCRRQAVAVQNGISGILSEMYSDLAQSVRTNAQWCLQVGHDHVLFFHILSDTHGSLRLCAVSVAPHSTVRETKSRNCRNKYISCTNGAIHVGCKVGYKLLFLDNNSSRKKWSRIFLWNKAII